MEISACPRCGSRDLHVPTIADGGISGYSVTAAVVCGKCAFQGSPIVFPDQAAYEAFLAALAGDASPAAQDEPDVLTAEEEDLLRDAETAAPTRQGSPATAVLIGVLGLAMMAVTPFLVAGTLSNALRGRPVAVAVAGVASALIEFLEAWAVLRIAKRLWRGGPAPDPAAP